MVSKRSPIDEVHSFLEARAMIPLISDLFQEHPSMNHLMEQGLLKLDAWSKLQQVHSA
jgi:hypothetical protein